MRSSLTIKHNKERSPLLTNKQTHLSSNVSLPADSFSATLSHPSQIRRQVHGKQLDSSTNKKGSSRETFRRGDTSDLDLFFVPSSVEKWSLRWKIGESTHDIWWLCQSVSTIITTLLLEWNIVPFGAAHLAEPIKKIDNGVKWLKYYVRCTYQQLYITSFCTETFALLIIYRNPNFIQKTRCIPTIFDVVPQSTKKSL